MTGHLEYDRKILPGPLIRGVRCGGGWGGVRTGAHAFRKVERGEEKKKLKNTREAR